jgi:hypothetical protein
MFQGKKNLLAGYGMEREEREKRREKNPERAERKGAGLSQPYCVLETTFPKSRGMTGQCQALR